MLLDLNYTRDTTTGREGLELLSELQALDATLPVVVMTAWGSVDRAVEAMRRGARDYIEKPWDNARLLATLRTQVELGRALRRDPAARGREPAAPRATARPALIAESAAMRPVLQLIERVAPSDANVLITGEHGTGKEVVAQWIHAASPRAARPLVAVNAGGLSEGLFESELFGHVKGAFTDARSRPHRPLRAGRRRHAVPRRDRHARARASRPSCCACWRPARSSGWAPRARGEIDVRVLSATNADLRGRGGARDASARICCSGSTPSRSACRRCASGARTSRPLAEHFLARYAGALPEAARRRSSPRRSRRSGAPLAGQRARARPHARARGARWPHGHARSAPADLGLRGARRRPRRLEDLTLEEVERVLIRKALERHGGNVSQAAKALGLSRSALYRRLQHHGL